MAEKEIKEKKWLVDTFQTVVCKDKRLVPFLNVFIFEGLTQQQKKLGQLFGAIQVFDYDEKSAYLPNLIAQVIKKEFFREEKRSSEASFEAALHKANLALSDLASHEIVSWIGKFHAVIGAIQENNFWFTQTGGGKIILIRKKIANEISQGLTNEESSSHPIKTFSNISSGQLEDGDKIIFATENIFNKKRWDEFSRHITVFSSSELDNLLRSTVELEEENSGFVLANIQQGQVSAVLEKELPENSTSNDLNFFGTQEKTTAKIDNGEENTKDPGQPPVVSTESEKESSVEYSPFEKEPELYIKENDKIEPDLSASKQKEAEEMEETPQQELDDNKFFIKESVPSPLEKENYIKKSLAEKFFFWKHPKVQFGFKKVKVFPQKSWRKINDLKPTLVFSSSKNKIDAFFQKKENSAPVLSAIKGKVKDACPSTFPQNKIFVLAQKFLSFWKQWLALAMILLFFFLAKYFLTKNTPPENFPNNPAGSEQSQINTQKDPEEKNLKELASLPEKIVFLALLKEKLYFFTENKNFYQLDELEEKSPNLKKIDLNQETQKAENLTAMNDLNLVFLITQNQVFAYSPVTGKILPNDINSLPEQKTASFSYLTYLYFLNSTNNQIVQYPRAGTGFGAKKDWLKETTDLQQAVDFSADEAIYVLFDDGRIARYFRGKKTTEFFPEKDGQKMIGQKIRTSVESEWIFLLSAENKSVFQLDKTGKIINQWSSSQLTSAQNMEVDFAKKTIFITNQEQKVLEIKY